MRTFIIEQGVHDSGKTSVIRKIYELLAAAYPDAAESHAFHGKRDFRVVLNIDGILIGIESYGDPQKIEKIAERLKLYCELGCQVIICACRSKGVTVEAIEDFVKRGDRVEWRSRGPIAGEAAQTKANLAEAKWVLEQVADLLRAYR